MKQVIFIISLCVISIAGNAQLVAPDAPDYYRKTAFNLAPEDAPKVAYKYHPGEVLIKGGLRIKGQIKFEDLNGFEPHLSVKAEGSKKKKKIAWSMIRRLALLNESAPLLLETDSVIYEWLDDKGDLFRIVRSDEIQLYDNLYVINEDFVVIPNYRLMAYDDYDGYKTIRRSEDLKAYTRSNPYLLNALSLTGRTQINDPYALVDLIDLYFNQNIAEHFNWDSMRVHLKDGDIFTGRGVAQVTDFDRARNTNPFAVLHFYNEDNDMYRIYNHRDIDKIVLSDERVLKPVAYNKYNIFCWAEEWNFKEETFWVTKKYIPNPDFFWRFYNSVGEDLIFLKNTSSEKKMRVVGEKSMIKSYVKYATDSRD